ncbi:MAG: glycoside hydrolase, partial [Planctomycetes bacterium]|nr:glycoside hydrolase [Planctomycetota bacterium]
MSLNPSSFGRIAALPAAFLAVFQVPAAGSYAHAGQEHPAGAEVQAVDFKQKTIYHSPETPGYTSWVGLWQLPDGRLRCDFRQLTGPKEKPVSTVPMLESRDGGETWTHLNPDAPAEAVKPRAAHQTTNANCRGMAVLPNGTLVRPVWSALSDEKGAAYIDRSTDGGKTWGEKIYFLPHEKYRTFPTLIQPLRDGRLVLMAGCWKRGDYQNDPKTTGDPDDKLIRILANMTKMMFLSSDNGKTWSKPIVLMPTDVGVCEESDFCELPGGDLFWVHRVEHFLDHATDRSKSPLAPRMGGPSQRKSHPYWYNDRMQSIAYKKGETFVPGKCEPAALPHSGSPEILYTQEGIILHLATDGVCWTADLGKTWTRLDIPGTPYYPRALQLKDGTILCVGHVGGDDAYGTVDQSIRQQTFRLQVRRAKAKRVEAQAPGLGPRIVTIEGRFGKAEVDVSAPSLTALYLRGPDGLNQQSVLAPSGMKPWATGGYTYVVGQDGRRYESRLARPEKVEV